MLTTALATAPKPADAATLASAPRVFAIYALEAASTGPPVMPMGVATSAEVLWRDDLEHDPADTHWPGRDRFVLSCGHGSSRVFSNAAWPVNDPPISLRLPIARSRGWCGHHRCAGRGVAQGIAIRDRATGGSSAGVIRRIDWSHRFESRQMEMLPRRRGA